MNHQIYTQIIFALFHYPFIYNSTQKTSTKIQFSYISLGTTYNTKAKTNKINKFKQVKNSNQFQRIKNQKTKSTENKNSNLRSTLNEKIFCYGNQKKIIKKQNSKKFIISYTWSLHIICIKENKTYVTGIRLSTNHNLDFLNFICICNVYCNCVTTKKLCYT